MSFEITEGNRYLGIWHCGNAGVDFLAIAWQDLTTGEYQGQYRFRYSDSTEPWDREDKKSWYTVRLGEQHENPVAHLREMMTLAASMTAKFAHSELEYDEIDGGPDEVMRVLFTKAWSHIGPMVQDGEDLDQAVEPLFAETDRRLGRAVR